MTSSQRTEAAEAAKKLLIAHDFFTSSQQIACYFSQDDEFDCMPIIKEIWHTGKKCYLPILSSQQDKTLQFAEYHPHVSLQLNRYKILEPMGTAPISLEELDLVIVPLVGFDTECHRLGRGGGYYDRTFASNKMHKQVSKPYLLGLAYEAQRVDTIPQDQWDVRLDGVVTEKRILSYQPRV